MVDETGGVSGVGVVPNLDDFAIKDRAYASSEAEYVAWQAARELLELGERCWQGWPLIREPFDEAVTIKAFSILGKVGKESDIFLFGEALRAEIKRADTSFEIDEFQLQREAQGIDREEIWVRDALSEYLGWDSLRIDTAIRTLRSGENPYALLRKIDAEGTWREQVQARVEFWWQHPELPLPTVDPEGPNAFRVQGMLDELASMPGYIRDDPKLLGSLLLVVVAVAGAAYVGPEVSAVTVIATRVRDFSNWVLALIGAALGTYAGGVNLTEVYRFERLASEASNDEARQEYWRLSGAALIRALLFFFGARISYKAALGSPVVEGGIGTASSVPSKSLVPYGASTSGAGARGQALVPVGTTTGALGSQSIGSASGWQPSLVFSMSSESDAVTGAGANNRTPVAQTSESEEPLLPTEATARELERAFAALGRAAETTSVAGESEAGALEVAVSSSEQGLRLAVSALNRAAGRSETISVPPNLHLRGPSTGELSQSLVAANRSTTTALGAAPLDSDVFALVVPAFERVSAYLYAPIGEVGNGNMVPPPIVTNGPFSPQGVQIGVQGVFAERYSVWSAAQTDGIWSHGLNLPSIVGSLEFLTVLKVAQQLAFGIEPNVPEIVERVLDRYFPPVDAVQEAADVDALLSFASGRLPIEDMLAQVRLDGSVSVLDYLDHFPFADQVFESVVLPPPYRRAQMSSTRITELRNIFRSRLINITLSAWREITYSGKTFADVISVYQRKVMEMALELADRYVPG